mgnify:FL=1
MMQTIHLKKLLLHLALPVCVGFIAAYFSRNAAEVYASLQLPPLSPPPVVFAVVWSVLYPLMGVASYLASEQMQHNARYKRVQLLYLASLFLNLIYPILFFTLQWYGAALVDLILLWICVFIVTAVYFYYYRPAGYIMFLYVLWLCFAAYLNAGVVCLN